MNYLFGYRDWTRQWTTSHSLCITYSYPATPPTGPLLESLSPWAFLRYPVTTVSHYFLLSGFLLIRELCLKLEKTIPTYYSSD